MQSGAEIWRNHCQSRPASPSTVASRTKRRSWRGTCLCPSVLVEFQVANERGFGDVDGMDEPAQKVAELFTIARANQPCLLFMDEIEYRRLGR